MEALNELKVNQDTIVEEKSGINATQLKLIALLTMFIDHIVGHYHALLIDSAQANQNLSLFISLEGILILMRLIGGCHFLSLLF